MSNIKTLCKKIFPCFAVPWPVYVLLIIFSILFFCLYKESNEDIYQNIYLTFFSSFISILSTSFFIDFFSNWKEEKNKYEIKKDAFIRCSYLIYLINDLWSDLVEPCIDKNKYEDIFTESVYRLVVKKIDMRCCAPGTFVSQMESYIKKRII